MTPANSTSTRLSSLCHHLIVIGVLSCHHEAINRTKGQADSHQSQAIQVRFTTGSNIGYTTAIYDTYLATRHPQRAKPFICVKQPAPKRDDVIADFVKFAGANPELADKPAAGTVLGFLAMRFPCGRK